MQCAEGFFIYHLHGILWAVADFIFIEINLMRKLVMVFLICWLCTTAKSQTVKEIFQYNWVGASVQDGGNLTKDGKIYLNQKLKIYIDGENKLTGKITTVFTLDDVSYTRVANIKGSYDPSSYEIYID